MATQSLRTSSPKLDIQALLNFSKWWEAREAEYKSQAAGTAEAPKKAA